MQQEVKIRKKGFTLVELVVVIAIIAILAGVGIVSYASVLGKARNSAAEQELNQLNSLMITDAYVNEEIDFEFDGKFHFENGTSTDDAKTAVESWVANILSNNDNFIKISEIVISIENNKIKFTYNRTAGGTADISFDIIGVSN